MSITLVIKDVTSINVLLFIHTLSTNILCIYNSSVILIVNILGKMFVSDVESATGVESATNILILIPHHNV